MNYEYFTFGIALDPVSGLSCEPHKSGICLIIIALITDQHGVSNDSTHVSLETQVSRLKNDFLVRIETGPKQEVETKL